MTKTTISCNINFRIEIKQLFKLTLESQKMSIEQHLTALTVALEDNTAALNKFLASGVSTSAKAEVSAVSGETTAAKSKTKAKSAEPEKPKSPVHTQSETTAAIIKVKDAFGIDEAKKVVESLGFARMSDITEDKYDEAFALAEKVFNELTQAADSEEDGGL